VASINYVMNRVHAYPITNEKAKELNIIQDTLYNNEYNNKNLNIRYPINKKQKYKPTTQNNKMGCVHALWKRNKRNRKTLQTNKY
jgi:hypothetical protein